MAVPTDGLGAPELASFYKTPFGWEKIRSRCAKFTAINSDNDPYVDLRHGKVLEKQLGAKLLVLHARGHFSSSEGTMRLPEALEAVLEMTGD